MVKDYCRNAVCACSFTRTEERYAEIMPDSCHCKNITDSGRLPTDTRQVRHGSSFFTFQNSPGKNLLSRDDYAFCLWLCCGNFILKTIYYSSDQMAGDFESLTHTTVLQENVRKLPRWDLKIRYEMQAVQNYIITA